MYICENKLWADEGTTTSNVKYHGFVEPVLKWPDKKKEKRKRQNTCKGFIQSETSSQLFTLERMAFRNPYKENFSKKNKKRKLRERFKDNSWIKFLEEIIVA